MNSKNEYHLIKMKKKTKNKKQHFAQDIIIVTLYKKIIRFNGGQLFFLTIFVRSNNQI